MSRQMAGGEVFTSTYAAALSGMRQGLGGDGECRPKFLICRDNI